MCMVWFDLKLESCREGRKREGRKRRKKKKKVNKKKHNEKLKLTRFPLTFLIKMCKNARQNALALYYTALLGKLKNTNWRVC